MSSRYVGLTQFRLPENEWAMSARQCYRTFCFSCMHWQHVKVCVCASFLWVSVLNRCAQLPFTCQLDTRQPRQQQLEKWTECSKEERRGEESVCDPASQTEKQNVRLFRPNLLNQPLLPNSSPHSPNFMLPLFLQQGKYPATPESPPTPSLKAQAWGAGWQLSHEAVWRRKAQLGQTPMGPAAHSGVIVLQTWAVSLTDGPPQFILCFPFTPAFSSSNSVIFNPSFTFVLLPFPSDSYRSARLLNINKAAELQKEKTGKDIGRNDWGREGAAEESGKKAEGDESDRRAVCV